MTRTISEEETELLLYRILGSKLDINEETRAKTFQVAIERARQCFGKRENAEKDQSPTFPTQRFSR